MGKVAIGDQSQYHGILDVYMAAKGTRQTDGVDFLQVQLVHQQLHACIERCLGTLDGADIVLGDGNQGFTFADHVGEGAAVLYDTWGFCSHGTVKQAVLIDDAGQI